MALVQAYDTRTGDKLPHLVRDAAVSHPVLGKHLSLTPRQKAAEKKAAPAATAPAAGDRKD